MSNTMFRKLKNSYKDLDAKQGEELQVRFGIVSEGTFMGIAYNNADVDTSAISDLLDKLPEDKISIQYMAINHEVPPHVDNGINTVINIYAKTGGYTTTFHKAKEGAIKHRLPNQDSGYVCGFHEVDNLDSFVAEDGDAYVLNVAELHSVHSGKSKERAALCINTTLEFNEVVELLGDAVG